MDTDYVKAQVSGPKAEDRIIAVHRAWPLDDGCGVSVVGLDAESPTSNFLQSTGPDVGANGDAGPEYYLFAVFDGHNSDAASSFALNNLVPVMEAYLPVPEMAEGMDGAAAWAGAVQEAMVKTLLEIDHRFAARGVPGGTTATLILQIGQLVTCVSVGHSRAILDTGTTRLDLTQTHTLAANPAECERLRAAGCTLARADIGGGGPAVVAARGRGPQRVWPGGLTLSRSLGDFALGPALLSVPHVVAVMLPPTGGRIILASDGVWKAGGEAAMAATAAVPLQTAAHTMLKSVAGRLRGDASVIVADTVPRGESFPHVAARLARARGLTPAPTQPSKLWGLLKLRKPSTGAGEPVVARTPSQMQASDPGDEYAPRVLTDCDVAQLMGLTTHAPHVDDPRPIWYEDSVAEDLNNAREDAWRMWSVARSLARTSGSRGLRATRSIGGLSELPGYSGLSDQGPPQDGHPNFARRSCLKAPGESTDGGGSDTAGGAAGASSDETQVSPASNKRVSFAGERQMLRRTSSEAVLMSSTPPSWMAGGLLSDSQDEAPAPLGDSVLSGSTLGASSRSIPVVSGGMPGRPPRPLPALPQGPDFSALIGSPNTRWRSSYQHTASVFTRNSRERDRMR